MGNDLACIVRASVAFRAEHSANCGERTTRGSLDHLPPGEPGGQTSGYLIELLSIHRRPLLLACIASSHEAARWMMVLSPPGFNDPRAGIGSIPPVVMQLRCLGTREGC
jgi:hypothetical protein